MAKPTIDLPPTTIHHYKPTKPMFFTNRHTATNHQSKPSKANTSQLQTHPHPNPPQNLATHDHDPPKEGRHSGNLPSDTAAIHPVARRDPSRHDGDLSAARRQSIQWHDGDPQRCDSNPSMARRQRFTQRGTRERSWRSSMKTELGENEKRKVSEKLNEERQRVKRVG
nr:hypothetical protein CFP56_19705 [Quercus suber]